MTSLLHAIATCLSIHAEETVEYRFEDIGDHQIPTHLPPGPKPVLISPPMPFPQPPRRVNNGEYRLEVCHDRWEHHTDGRVMRVAQWGWWFYPD